MVFFEVYSGVFVDETMREIKTNVVEQWLNAASFSYKLSNIFKKRFLFKFKDPTECILFKIAHNITSTKENWKTVGGLTNT